MAKQTTTFTASEAQALTDKSRVLFVTSKPMQRVYKQIRKAANEGLASCSMFVGIEYAKRIKETLSSLGYTVTIFERYKDDDYDKHIYIEW